VYILKTGKKDSILIITPAFRLGLCNASHDGALALQTLKAIRSYKFTIFFLHPGRTRAML
jgi:hypothetical protein